MRKFILILAFFGMAFASEITQNALADCENGEMSACADLGEIYQNGFEGEAVDYEKALKFNQMACEGEDSSGCANLALMYVGGQGTVKNSAKATELFERACEGGQIFACRNLGHMYVEGDGVDKDLQKGAWFLDAACGNGDFIGCVYLARYLEKAGDMSYAKDFYEDACDMGKRDKDIREDRYMMQLWQEACKKRNLR